ncbi:LysR substrate-binding domain-containing protein [Devosia aquimaris]|uniref:LysR substrate-binding domain-containing protein n=1 Tax=Devosia aquimaris TaxID=2866214 RepID=UPI001CD16C52|nr:LysR substrate-binding domain-containing protein [Devosia sp. CJK-A8-3]
MAKLGKLPPLNALVVFEAASRLGSFSRAGVELGLTQSAVSRQIGKLESFIGSKLFARAVHGVHLTPVGEAYAVDISRALGDVAAVTEGIRSWAGPRQITIACSRGIADQWFMPRLTRMQREIAGLELRLKVTDDIVHLRLDEFDLAVFYRSERPVGVNITVLGREEIVPVSAPGLPPLLEVANPVAIGIEDVMREWQDWPQWWQSAGIAPPPPMRRWLLGDYGLCVAAAMQGGGYVLGWTWLIREQLEAGTLVPAHEHMMQSGGRFYLMRPADRHQRRIVREVSDWLIAHNVGDVG